MVSEFAQSRYHLSGQHINNVVQNVREGDMSIVLKAYEEEIKVIITN